MISIVIPAFNEEDDIGFCLGSLIKQQTSQPYEVVIVDNGSTDQTTSIVNSYSNRLNIRLCSESIHGRGAARARGCKEAQGDILACTDADAILPPHWLERIARHFKDVTIVAVTGPQKVNDLSPVKSAIFNLLQPAAMHIYRILMGHYWMNGFNCAVRKSVYDSVGGFKTNLDAYEDNELARRVAKAGKIKYSKDLEVIASGRRFKPSFLKGLWTYAKTYIEMFFLKKERVLLSNVRDKVK